MSRATGWSRIQRRPRKWLVRSAEQDNLLATYTLSRLYEGLRPPDGLPALYSVTFTTAGVFPPQWALSRKGTVDLHAHSPESVDFDQDAGQDWPGWVKAAADAGPHAIAITDHNTASGISRIQGAAMESADAPVVFPGVEMTVGGVHLLVLVDPACRDAEFVLSLEAGDGQSRIACEGGLQEDKVRDEICRVMEGGREAFESRYRRIMSADRPGA